MRISDWSSDVCSSDLGGVEGEGGCLGVERGKACTGCACVKAEAIGCPAAVEHGCAPARPGVDPCGDVLDGVHGVGEEGCLGAQIGRASCRERVCQYV